jgi:hypothetical protein
MFDTAAGTVQPGGIFNDKKDNDNNFYIPNKIAGSLGNWVGIGDKEDADNDIQEYNKNIDQLSRDCFAIDQVELDFFPEGRGHNSSRVV